MENNYSNLLYVQARTPDKLKEQLMAIDVPSRIVEGSWWNTGSMLGVWVILDRPVEKVKKKNLNKRSVDPTDETKTTILNKEV